MDVGIDIGMDIGVGVDTGYTSYLEYQEYTEPSEYAEHQPISAAQPPTEGGWWEGYERLAAAIVRQAVADYRSAHKLLRTSKSADDHMRAKTTIKEVERFIRSAWYETLMDTGAEKFLRILMARVQIDAMNDRRKKVILALREIDTEHRLSGVALTERKRLVREALESKESAGLFRPQEIEAILEKVKPRGTFGKKAVRELTLGRDADLLRDNE